MTARKIALQTVSDKSAVELRALLGQEFGAQELLESTLEAADAAGPQLNPFVHRLDERARAAASLSDSRIARGNARPLEGLPLTVKDTLWLEGVESADGCRARSGFVAPATDVAVQRVLDAGAVVFAKTTNPELCYFGYSWSELNGATANPWSRSRTSGGSSAGAAAALAAGIGPLALGSDGGGSLRIPAAFCGVAAHKPTNGVVPYWPDVAAWPTLSTIGPMARSSADLSLLLSVISGHEPFDPISAPSVRLDPQRDGLAGVRLAADVDRSGLIPIEPSVRTNFDLVLEELRGAGATVLRDRPVRHCSGAEQWLTIATSEARAAHGREYEERRELLGEDAVTFLAFADGISGVKLAQAQRRRVEIHAKYLELFERTNADALLTPALGLPAFGLDTPSPMQVAGVPIERPYDDWQGHLWDANLAQLPACVIPTGLGDGDLPVGLQIVGRRFADRRVLAIARAIEDLLALEMRPPGLAQ